MSKTNESPVFSLFAIAPPGLEEIVGGEVRRLGHDAAVIAGGVEWDGEWEVLRAANLHLRTAARVLVRAGAFRARTFFELERYAARVPWSRFVGEGRRVLLRVTSKKSRLYHEGAIAERLYRSIADATGALAAGAADEETEGIESQLFIVRVNRDAFTISADSSGALLHRRGYRQAIARAPLRENLAAALIEAADWTRNAPLLDPFCGSGTIPIEAALRARRIAPGLANAEYAPRAFAFESWPGHDEAGWQAQVDRARSQILETAGATIRGSDMSAAALRAAESNARRAGVADDIEWTVSSMRDAPVPAGTGVLVTNPPYGVRVTTDYRTRALYSEFGEFVRERLKGWGVVMLSPDEALERATQLRFHMIAQTRNGGIPVRLVTTVGPDRGREIETGTV